VHASNSIENGSESSTSEVGGDASESTATATRGRETRTQSAAAALLAWLTGRGRAQDQVEGQAVAAAGEEGQERPRYYAPYDTGMDRDHHYYSPYGAVRNNISLVPLADVFSIDENYEGVAQPVVGVLVADTRDGDETANRQPGRSFRRDYRAARNMQAVVQASTSE